MHLARARAVQDVALHIGGQVQRARDRPGEPRSLFTNDLTREVRPRKGCCDFLYFVFPRCVSVFVLVCKSDSPGT